MEEVIKLFNKHRVRYLLIGGQAVRLEGMPRFSMDWDFFIPSGDLSNLQKINDLIGDELDMPLVGLGRRGENFVQTYQTKWGVIQFHLGSGSLPAFDVAERQAVVHETENGVSVKCLSARHLLESKKKANRPQDQADIFFLEARRRAKPSDFDTPR